jgi:cytochrome P450 family 138
MQATNLLRRNAETPTNPTLPPPGPRLPKALATAMVVLIERPAMRYIHRRYGDVFTIDMPVFGRSTFVSRPDLVKQVFQASPEVLSYTNPSPLGKILGPGSLFSMDGRKHLDERRLILPAFHGERMRSYESIIEQEARKEMATWPSGSEFATLEPFMRITLNSILRCVFGAEGSDVDQLAKILPEFVTLGSRLALLPVLQRDFGPGSPGRKFQRLRGQYDEIIDRMISEALADPELEQRNDVMSMLLRAHYEDGSYMSRTAIADELLTLLAAGHETTATSLAWAVERLSRNPWVLRRLANEARSSDENKFRMATIYEIQRSRPVISATGRHTLQPFRLDNFTVPAGQHVVVLASMIHQDARFFERPKEFQPDRFIEQRPDSYTWVPFGGGTRRCPGAAFAHMEMDIVLRTLLRSFDLNSSEAADEGWRNRGIAFAPAKGGIGSVTRLQSPDANSDFEEAAENVA